MLQLLRTLIGLAIGIALFLVGIPALQSLVKRIGYYDHFTYEQAALAYLLIIACVIAAQLTGVRAPREKD